MSIKRENKIPDIVKAILISLGIVITIVLIARKTIVGLFFAGFILLNLFIYNYIKASRDAKSEGLQNNNQISFELLGRSKKLLRYATAILAFLSFYTTSQGMKDFVFSTEWLAYMGSFAVQSILVVFSLLLCHFFVQIDGNNSFSSKTKVLLKSVLKSFFLYH